MKKLIVNVAANDTVYTNPDFAKKIIDHFNPTGFCLDPCSGKDAFYQHLPDPKDWCEIDKGKDFLTYDKKCDWIITNPPWSGKLYKLISSHAFELADNVVFLIRLDCALTMGLSRHNYFKQHNHSLKEIIIVPWKDVGFGPSGFVLSVIHWKKNYVGDCKFTYWT